MATKKITLRYGVAAVVIALAVIGTSLFVTPTTKAQTNFVVMLTDPPSVPKGTTKLEVTYSNIQLHVIGSDGTSNWVASQESGTVDLLSLVNVTQTIASLNLATGSTVDKLQFKISSAKATIDGEVHSVNILSEQLVVTLKKTRLDGTNAGALIDLRPKLIQIRAVDADGAPVSYYVLVPSATAVVKTNVSEEHRRVGAKHNLTDEDNDELEDEYEQTTRDLTITGASLKVEGDKTTLTVTLKNTGAENVTIHGLTVYGDFSFSKPIVSGGHGGGEHDDDHPRAVPFQVSGGKLIPRMGDDGDHHEDGKGLELKPGETVTLTFSDVIHIHPDKHGKAPPITITAIKGNKYTIRASGEGSKTFEVTAS